MRQNYFKNTYGEMWIEDGIFFVTYNEGVIITKEIMVYLVSERLRITENTTFPMLFDTRGMKYATKEAREYSNQGDGIKYLSAAAFVVNSTVLQIFMNYYLKIYPFSFPVRLFIDGDKALQWLQRFKQEKEAF